MATPCNLGDVKTFTLQNAPADGGGYTYVWKWWDGTVDVTRVPTVNKTMNVGGTLNYSLIQTDAYGRSHEYDGTIVVNFAPTVIGSPTISQNDAAFPFSTVLSSTSYDPDHPGGTELSFAWYNGPTLIGAGTTVIPSTGTYTNFLNVLAVTENETLTQVITDTSNSSTTLNYFLRGYTPSGLQGSSSSISNSLVSSANNLSQIIIGPGQLATFTAYAQDTSQGQLQFIWTAGTLDGWINNLTVTDDPSRLPNGLYKSQIVQNVGTETAGLKTVFCTVTNLNTQQSVTFDTTVTLVAPQVPVVTSISTDAPIINGGYAVSQSGFVHFSANASDPNAALLSYRWDFSQPTVTLYGRKVMLRPSDYSVFDEAILEGNGTTPGTGPLPITGNVTVTDRFGQSATVAFQQFATTLVWPFTQVSPQTSGTGSTTLQKRYWGVSLATSIQDTDLVGFTSDFASARNLSQQFIPTAQYVYFVYPAAFGGATINIITDGVVSTDWLLTTQEFNSVLYNVYRSSVPLTGLMQITIT